MKYIFLLGVGRSGTSWVGKVLSSTSDALIYFEEPITKFRKYPESNCWEKWSFNANASEETIDWYVDRLKRLPFEYEELLRSGIIKRSVHSNSENPEFVLIKEVHNLSAWHRVISKMENVDVIVIDRNPYRILDSYFHNFPRRNNYVDEYRWLRECVLDSSKIKDKLYHEVVGMFSENALDYIKKPFSKTAEFIRFFISILFARNCVRRVCGNYYYLPYEFLCKNPKFEFGSLFDTFNLSWDCGTDEILEQTMSKDERNEPYSVCRADILVGDKPFKYLTKGMVEILKGME